MIRLSPRCTVLRRPAELPRDDVPPPRWNRQRDGGGDLRCAVDCTSALRLPPLQFGGRPSCALGAGGGPTPGRDRRVRGERCRHATHRSREGIQREERAHGSAARGGPLDPRRRVRHDPRLVGCVKSTLLNLVVGLGPTRRGKAPVAAIDYYPHNNTIPALRILTPPPSHD